MTLVRGAGKFAGIPRYSDFHWPIICALKEIGGSATIDELNDRVATDMKISEELLAVPHGDGGMTEVEYRLAWARTYLKKVGAIVNSERGVWSLTSKGRMFTQRDAAEVTRQVRDQAKRERAGDEQLEIPGEKADIPEETWKERLLAVLKAMPPDGFERLSQRILRESGFTKVNVLGRSGDGGIDGAGILRMNLVSFHVIFQCKRWKDAVPPSVIRDFRGAMIGRADKEIIITTGRFTSDAQKEAVRDGAPAIDLVDGEVLCDLLKELRFGVRVRSVEVVEIHPDDLQGI